MSIRSPDGALTSEFLFDNVSELSLFSQPVDISKWREDIPAQSNFRTDFYSTSDSQDSNGSDASELKDTASESSMDSAYHSQSGASRRGATIQDGYQVNPRQEFPSRMSIQFTGELSSPSLASDHFVHFPEPGDLSQGHMESGDSQFWYTNHSTAQDASTYSTTTTTAASRLSQRQANGANYGWGPAEAGSFSFPSPIMAAYNSSQDFPDLFSQPQVLPQQQHQSTQLRNSPMTVSTTSSFTVPALDRQVSEQSINFNTFVASSPNVAQLTSFPDQHLPESRMDREETASASSLVQSGPDDEETSSVDATETGSTEEERNKKARSHPLYQRGPEADGMYHCPQEGQPGCNHKPTGLKCNYDKFVDSHLKPFRCNKKSCTNVQFSSTACLLRHEREAHGLHGHGDRPHLCLFSDCERASPGNGFPRRYNLYDHMKRVHDYHQPDKDDSNPESQQNARKQSRKRKSMAEEAPEKKPKVVKLSPEQQRRQERTKMEQDFVRTKHTISEILTQLKGPEDLSDKQKVTLHKVVFSLSDLAAKYKDIGG